MDIAYTGPISIVCALFRGDPVWIPSYSRVYGPEWVDKLYRACRRNLTRPLRFVCLSDWPQEAFTEPVEAVPFITEDRSWMCINEVFRPDLELGRAMFTGLDSVVIGSLEDLASYDGPCAMTRCPLTGVQSNALVVFEDAEMAHLYERWSDNPGSKRSYTCLTTEGYKPAEYTYWVAERDGAIDDLEAICPGQVLAWYGGWKRKIHGRWVPSPDGCPNARLLYFVGGEKQPSKTDPVITENWT